MRALWVEAGAQATHSALIEMMVGDPLHMGTREQMNRQDDPRRAARMVEAVLKG